MSESGDMYKFTSELLIQNFKNHAILLTAKEGVVTENTLGFGILGHLGMLKPKRLFNFQ